MDQRHPFRTILLLAAVSSMLFAGLPLPQQAEATDNLDESLLLLAASMARQAALQPDPKNPNELHIAAASYRAVAAEVPPSSRALYQSMYETANKFETQATALERRRTRGGPLRQVGRFLGRVVGRTMDFVSRAAETYVEGQIDQAIDKLDNAPSRAVQRQLNPLWRILGSKLGGPLTGLLRKPVDRLIRRNVDRILSGRPHRSPARVPGPSSTTEPGAVPSPSDMAPLGEFLESDCAVEGLEFSSIAVDYFASGPNEGPHLNCKTSEFDGFLITPFSDPGQLEAGFQQGRPALQGIVDQANEWNSQPALPAELVWHVAVLADDSSRYMLAESQYSNVRNCVSGKGLGNVIVDGRFLVQLSYVSHHAKCGPADLDAYVLMLEKLEAAAMAAIDRLHAQAGP